MIVLCRWSNLVSCARHVSGHAVLCDSLSITIQRWLSWKKADHSWHDRRWKGGGEYIWISYEGLNLVSPAVDGHAFRHNTDVLIEQKCILSETRGYSISTKHTAQCTYEPNISRKTKPTGLFDSFIGRPRQVTITFCDYVQTIVNTKHCCWSTFLWILLFAKQSASEGDHGWTREGYIHSTARSENACHHHGTATRYAACISGIFRLLITHQLPFHCRVWKGTATYLARM